MPLLSSGRFRRLRFLGQIYFDIDAAVFRAACRIVAAVEVAVRRYGAAFTKRDDLDPAWIHALAFQISRNGKRTSARHGEIIGVTATRIGTAAQDYRTARGSRRIARQLV